MEAYLVTFEASEYILTADGIDEANLSQLTRKAQLAFAALPTTSSDARLPKASLSATSFRPDPGLQGRVSGRDTPFMDACNLINCYIKGACNVFKVK